jgi:uncharacterized protein
MFKPLMMISFSMILLGAGVACAENPSPAAMDAARSLVTTLKVTEQYKALVPGILSGLRPTLSQDRPEIEREFDAAVTTVLEDHQSKYYNSIIERAAALYANTFSTDELRTINSFYQSPAGQKYFENSHELSETSQKVVEDVSREAADEVKARMTQLLRDKGHKL